MSFTAVRKPVRAIINQSVIYPYTSDFEISGISIINNDTAAATFTVSTFPEISFTVPAGSTYDGDFVPFKTISATGTSFQIEMRG